MNNAEQSKRALCYQENGGLGDYLLALPSMVAFQAVNPSSVFCVPDSLYNLIKEANLLNNILPFSDLEIELSKLDQYDYKINFTLVMTLGDTDNYVKNLESSSEYAEKHASHLYFDGLSQIEPRLSKKTFTNLLEMPILKIEVNESFFYDYGIEQNNYFTIHAGAGYSLKVWDRENFENTIIKLLDKYPNYKCVVIQGPEDPELNLHEQVIVFKEPLEKVAKLLSKSLFHIDNDSGINHLAGALDVTTITIFGPTEPVKWKPLSKNSLFLWGRYNCGKPCDYMSVKSCSDRVCLSIIKPSDIVELVDKILN